MEVKEKEGTRPAVCESCGGSLEQKDAYLYQCTSCKRKYYISADRTHKVSVRLSAGKIILICAAVAVFITAVAVAGYQFYTGRMVASASRFSVVFRDFLMEAYQKPAADISKEDLEQIKYLKIEENQGYQFTYSYEDFYTYTDPDKYEKTLHTITIKGRRDDFSPTNVQYFTGLTRLELYTGAWENYVLPEENQLRCLYCTDGLSRYGTPQFFDRINPDTLEEVAILGAEDLKDFSFMENLKGVRRFLLEGAVLEDGELFKDLNKLEELYLPYVVMEEDSAVSIVKDLLKLPSLNHIYIEGKSAWYIPDDQWEEWEQTYRGRIRMERK